MASLEKLRPDSPPDLRARLAELRAHLITQVKGQEHVIERVCSVLVRGELGMAHPRRPRGSFLFVGPTGVGKTELTNVFTSYLFEEAKPHRFDMSEYQLQKSVDKLIGENVADPGLLGQILRTARSGTLLFDEIEKAHPLVLDLFLQILEDARITVATGDTFDLSGFYLVCTSNIGSTESMRMESAPFSSVERTVMMRVREQMRPELVGRFTDLLVFRRLDYATQRAICEQMIASEQERLARLGHHLEVSSEAVEFLVRAGYHRFLGARPMRNVVESSLQHAVAQNILSARPGSGLIVVNPKSDHLYLH